MTDEDQLEIGRPSLRIVGKGPSQQILRLEFVVDVEGALYHSLNSHNQSSVPS